MASKNNSGKLILTEYAFGQKSRDAALFYCDGTLEYLKVLPPGDNLAVGTILIGKCRHQVLNIPAAFFALNQEGTIGFLPTGDLKYTRVLNRHFQGKLSDGDEVLLQVKREPVKTKDYAVTDRIELAGRYCIAKFGSGRLFCSKNHHQSVKDVISSYFRQKGLCAADGSLIGFSGYDLILRTKAQKLVEAREMDVLYRDCDDTLRALDSLVSTAAHRSCYSVLEKPAGWFEGVCEEIESCGYKIEECLTDSYRLYTEMQEKYRAGDTAPTDLCDQSLNNLSSKLKKQSLTDVTAAAPDGSRIRYYQDSQVPLSVLYGISSRIEEALRTKAWLKNGGYICIEQTEAMTVVDVNSGSSTHGKDSEKLYFETNMEAAAEILRQLRLRNITGVIVIDFINMSDKSRETEILELMKNKAVQDYQKIHIYEFTKLGLLEMVREKKGKSLRESINEEMK
ncbi:MAG: ribonuclease E/G [Lachnospiraceae bacterium]|nr:ribonuclease E/G [Lachnospiraceae bacterium]